MFPLAGSLLCLLRHLVLFGLRGRRCLLRLRVFWLVLVRVRPLDVTREIDPCCGDPFIQSLVEAVEIAVELHAALCCLDTENLGSSRLSFLLYPGDASCLKGFGGRFPLESGSVRPYRGLTARRTASHDEKGTRVGVVDESCVVAWSCEMDMVTNFGGVGRI